MTGYNISVCSRGTANKSSNSPQQLKIEVPARPQSRSSTEWSNSKDQLVPVPRKSARFALGTLLSRV
ncbi:hypothetical protein V1264_019558 [Littorina saxatilis]|uniref:Uncharacterized protein n=1 Tax=Littorina saxatilis TaxID=31220 RepID=A0AAN9BG53_9CAEN